MDAINELIKRETEKVLYGSTCIFSTPCRVIQRVNDELFEVETITNHTRYTVYNYSGSNIQENENVMLYYKGRVLSNQSAYIGAVLNKSTINYITGKYQLITLGESEEGICEFIYNTLVSDTTSNLVFNAVITSESDGTAYFKIYIDGMAIDYLPITNVNQGYTHCSFNIPLSIQDAGIHDISIRASGVGTISQLNIFLQGQNIQGTDIEIANESDFEYKLYDDYAKTLRYLGTKTKIKIPETFEGKPLKIIGEETFYLKDMEQVLIPDGVETIK